MSTRLPSLLISLFFVVLLFGCHKDSDILIGELSLRNVDDRYFSFVATHNTLTSSMGTFTLRNQSETPYQYDGAYLIEILLEDGWHIIEGNFQSDLRLYTLQTDETIAFDYNWSSAYGELPTGKYRLIKEIFHQEYPENKETFWVGCEFSIP